MTTRESLVGLVERLRARGELDAEYGHFARSGECLEAATALEEQSRRVEELERIMRRMLEGRAGARDEARTALSPSKTVEKGEGE